MRGSPARPSRAHGLAFIPLALLLIGGCGDDPVGPDGDHKVISGRVVLAETGEAVLGAKVFLNPVYLGCGKIIDPQPAFRDSAQTDRFGRFAFRVPLGSRFQVYAGRDGSGLPTRFSHLARPLQVDLTSVAAVTLVDMALHEVQSGSSISGVTYNKATGEIIAGAQVRLSRFEGHDSVAVGDVDSDVGGRFRFDGLYTGIYWASAGAEVEIDTYLVHIDETVGPLFLPGKTHLGNFEMYMEHGPLCLP